MTARGAISRIAAAVARLVTRGRIELVDDASGPYQRLQVRGLFGEVLDGVHRVQPFGLVSVPRTGADVVLLEVGGSRDHVIAIAVADEAQRPIGLLEGEVALHGEGYVGVRCKPSGEITIEGPSGVVVKVGPSGDVEVTGGSVSISGSSVTVDGSVQIDGKDFLAHTHGAGGLIGNLGSPVSGNTGAVS